MKTFMFVILAAFLGLVAADQPPFPDLEIICESREPFRQFEECLSENIPESFKSLFRAYFQCLGHETASGVLNAACEKLAEGVDKLELLRQVERCSPVNYGIQEPSNEDKKLFDESFETCGDVLLPYFLTAVAKHQAQNQ